MPNDLADFVVVANRLPVDRITTDDGHMSWRSSPGGLVTALEPVLRAHHGAWVGWHGATDEVLDPFEHDGMHLVPVPLSEIEVAEYYEGFSNATLWPLYHDVVRPPEFHREWWDAYVQVNRRFAEQAAAVASEGAFVWVQDYQLQLVPQMLRELRSDLRIGFFLHIPFPPTELFGQLPWRREILEGLLGADSVGFQMPGAAQNFVRLVRQRVVAQVLPQTGEFPRVLRRVDQPAEDPVQDLPCRCPRERRRKDGLRLAALHEEPEQFGREGMGLARPCTGENSPGSHAHGVPPGIVAEGDELQAVVAEVAALPLQAFADELNRTITLLQQQRRHLRPSRVVLFGGGEAVRNIGPFLTTKLELPVVPWSLPDVLPTSARLPPLPVLGPAVALSALAWEAT